jgi:hypothetical protein
MQNTIRYALFLFIVSGLLFTACDREVVDPDLEIPTAEEVEEATGIDTLEMDEATDEDGNPVPQVEDDPEDTSSTRNGSTGSDSASAEESSVYEDGTYSADGSYTSPAGAESIGVSLIVENDIVTSVSIQNKATDANSVIYQQLFTEGISAQVIGKSLDEIGGYSSVNGSSLTPNGFDQALASIKMEAAL